MDLHSRLYRVLSLVIVASLLLSPFNLAPSAQASSAANANTLNTSKALSTNQDIQSNQGIAQPGEGIFAQNFTPTGVASPATPAATSTAFSTSTSTSASTSTSIPSYTATAIITSSNTPTLTPIIERPPPITYTVGSPTVAPSVTPIPDRPYQQEAIDRARAELLAQIDALPALTGTITGTLVSGLTGGRINSPDGGITLGFMPGVVGITETINVQVNRVTFPPDDPRATREGYPLAYTYELTATLGVGGPLMEQFRNEVALVWNIDDGVLAQAGVQGFPLYVYTYNEQNGIWEKVLTDWNEQTHQLIATVPHFSLYAVGDGFDAVNNYVPTVNDFETDLQSGTANVQYPLNLPSGPAGFGPKVSLSYNSGSTDRVDVTNQGASSVGWGWSLSTSYIAASQHHFAVTDHPWTASIAVDGINGDLVKDSTNPSPPEPTATTISFRTSNESFAKILYRRELNGNRTTDWWEVWGKDGTHYIFNQRAFQCDPHNGDHAATPNCPDGGAFDLTTYKWMLSSATDVNGNTITYTYRFELQNGDLVTEENRQLRTRAIYPYQIKYGGIDSIQGNKSKDLVEFLLAGEPGTRVERQDISEDDMGSGFFQSYYIKTINVKRLISSPPPTPGPSPTPGVDGYVTLRSYVLEQDHRVVLPIPTRSPTGTPSTTPCPNHECKHLTLNAISPKGNNGEQLPKVTFDYTLPDSTQCAEHGPNWRDWGKICKAHNGYGGRVDYYYDASGGSINYAFRRVWKKEIRDGLGESPPHKVRYLYDHRGGTTNIKEVSNEVNFTKPLHGPNSEFRGFGWARVQSPLDDAGGKFHFTDHYFSQTDEFKGKEWRVQSGKGDFFKELMTGTPTPNPSWNVQGTVTPTVDPQNANNQVWKLVPQVGTPATTFIERAQTTADGTDISLRFLLKSDTTPSDYNLESVWKIVNQTNPNDYWGLKIARKTVPLPGGSSSAYHAKVVWSKNNIYGERDLSNIGNGLTPRMTGPILTNTWYWLHLHTSPNGRLAVQLYRVAADGTDDDYPGTKQFIMIKSGDKASSGGDVNGNIPSFDNPNLLYGQTWKFRHEVNAVSPGTDSQMLIDDYTETRTLYSQSDTVYEDRTTVGAAPYTPQGLVGLENNCQGMNIRFVPPVESWDIRYGGAYDAVGGTEEYREYTSRRARQVFRYDNYGNTTDVDDYGKIGDTADERSTRSWFATPVAGGRYIVDRVGQVDQYRGIPVPPPPGVSAVRMAQARYYYDSLDGEGNHGKIPVDGKGRVTKVEQVGVDPNNGNVTTARSAQRFEYEEPYGNRTKVYDPNNNMTETGYDNYYHSFPVSTTYPNGRSETTTWNYGVDMPYSTTDMNGVITGFAYDSFGRPSKSWIGSGNDENNPNDQYFFSDLNLASVSPPFYISYQHRLGSSWSDKTWQTRWYDGRGRTVQDVSPKDSTSVIVVDSVYTDTGQIYLATLPYPAPAVSPTVKPPPIVGQPVITMHYDGVGRTTRLVNPDGTEILNDYGALLYTASTDETKRNVKLQHTDMQGRMDKVQEREVFPTATASTTPLVMEVQHRYDALDRLYEAIRDPSSQEYPQGLNIVARTYYDDLSRKSKMEDPDMGTWQYKYDLAGNMTEQRDARCIDPATNCPDPSHQVFFTYDNMNRVRAKYYGTAHYQPTATPTVDIPDVKYYYDNDLNDATTAKSWGRLRAAEVTLQGQGASKANGNRYKYDERGMLVQEVITTSLTTREYTIDNAYDPGGRPTTLTYPNPGTREQVTTFYNTQGPGLPSSMTSSMGGPPPVVDTTYNARGQLTYLRQGTNSPTTDNLFSAFTYDDDTGSTKRGWLTRAEVTTADGKRHLDLNMTYSDNGNVERVQQIATGGTNNPIFTNDYTYDGFNRLLTATSTNITLFPTEVYNFHDDQGKLDKLGRMRSRTIGIDPTYVYTYTNTNKPDAPRTYRGNTYEYNENGDQYQRSGNGSTQNRTFDPENRLSTITEGTTTTEMVYDANGGRIIKSVAVGIGGNPTRTLYIGSLYEEEISSTSTDKPYTNYYSFGGQMVGMRKGNQPTSADNRQLRIVGDHLGSTTLVVDTSNPPQVIHRQYYKPYGEIAYTTGSSQTSIGYTGQRLDGESGLMYYGARYYDPVLSFFISPDPVSPNKANPKSRERYAYVLNNPLRYTDATGLSPDGDFDLTLIAGNMPRSMDLSGLVAQYYGDYKAQSRPSEDQSNYQKCMKGDRAACVADFADLNISLEDQADFRWTLQELQDMLEATHKLMSVAGWSYSDFRSAMGRHTVFVKRREPIWYEAAIGAHGSAFEYPNYATNENVISFYENNGQGAFASREWLKVVTVHELAHAWDSASGDRLSQDMMNGTGGRYESGVSVSVCGYPARACFSLTSTYKPGGTTVSDYGANTHYEDFAESVAAAVYPDMFDRGRLHAAANRLDFVGKKFKEYNK